jgi:hypothetical protein
LTREECLFEVCRCFMEDREVVLKEKVKEYKAVTEAIQ